MPKKPQKKKIIELDTTLEKLDYQTLGEIEQLCAEYKIIDQLKLCRRKSKLSLAGLSRTTGISKATISKIENGRIGLTLKQMIRMAQALKARIELKLIT